MAGPAGIAIGMLLGHLYDARQSSFQRKDWERYIPKLPDGTDEQQAYRILGISPDCSIDEIKKVYRRLVTIYHPDRAISLGEEFTWLADKKTKEINEAYQQIRKKRKF